MSALHLQCPWVSPFLPLELAWQGGGHLATSMEEKAGNIHSSWLQERVEHNMARAAESAVEIEALRSTAPREGTGVSVNHPITWACIYSSPLFVSLLRIGHVLEFTVWGTAVGHWHGCGIGIA